MQLSDLKLGERPAGRTLLSARWVVGHRDGGHRLVENGEVVIENGEVLFVGRKFDGEVRKELLG